MTVIWGIIITAFAFLFVYDEGSKTVVESINKIGSAFYGPILAAFCMGLLSKRSTGTGVIIGTLAGVSFNVYLWLAQPTIYWMWWNLFGLVITCVVTMGLSMLTAPPSAVTLEKYTLNLGDLKERERPWLKVYAGLVVYFFVILGVCYACSTFSP